MVSNLEKNTMNKGVWTYLRVSTDGQSLDQQRRAVLQAVPRGLAKPIVLEEVASGKDDNRTQYGSLKQEIADGRVQHLFVWAIDRLGRNAREIREFVDLCCEHGVNLVSVKEKLDLSSPWRDVFVAILATMASLEWQRISDRTREKLEWYKKTFGWKGHGSPPKSADILQARVIKLVPKIHAARDAGMTIREIAAAFDITTRTTQKILKRPKAEWVTKADWVKDNPQWYKTPQDYGAPPSSRTRERLAKTAK